MLGVSSESLIKLGEVTRPLVVLNKEPIFFLPSQPFFFLFRAMQMPQLLAKF